MPSTLCLWTDIPIESGGRGDHEFRQVAQRGLRVVSAQAKRKHGVDRGLATLHGIATLPKRGQALRCPRDPRSQRLGRRLRVMLADRRFDVRGQHEGSGQRGARGRMIDQAGSALVRYAVERGQASHLRRPLEILTGTREQADFQKQPGREKLVDLLLTELLGQQLGGDRATQRVAEQGPPGLTDGHHVSQRQTHADAA